MLYSSQVIKGLEKVAPNYMTEKWREDEEYLSYVEDLLATEEVQKLAEYTQLVYYMICFTMIGAQQSLTKALMPMFIHELQPKMLKKLQSCLI